MVRLDKQLASYKEALLNELRIPENKVNHVATEIQQELSDNKDNYRIELLKASPIPIQERLDELSAFQNMMDTFNRMKPRPEIVRTQVITQNYISFVYLKDTLFEVLRKNSQPGTTIKKCTKFLVNNPIRAFRNSFAHGNWRYKSDFSGFEYYAHKDSKLDEPMAKYTVNQDELEFWQSLARVVGYVCYMELSSE